MTKRILLATLVLALLLGCSTEGEGQLLTNQSPAGDPSSQAAAGTETASLPQPGQTVFSLKRKIFKHAKRDLKV